MNRRNRRSVASAIAAVALAMAACPVSAQTKAQAAKAGANFLSPLKAAARAASRDLWGYMNNANAYPTASNQLGYMAFDAATAGNFRDLKTEGSRTMSPNGGSSYYDGKYHAVHFSMSQETGKLVVMYYQFNTEDNWHSEFAPELVSDPSLIATATATSQLTGKAYGQFYTSDMSSFEFGIIDYNEMDRTTIGPSKHKFVAMGVSSEERVYGIATDGILYELNTITGEETEVGPTGVYVAPSSEKSYTQSGAIDQDDDTFYWAAYDAERKGALYSVDLKTGKATLIADFPHNEQILGMAIPEATPDAAAPGTPSGFSVKFDGPSTKGWASLSAPSKTYGGQTLSGDVNYSVRSGKTEVLTGTMPANSSTTKEITAPEGLNNFTVTFSNAAGKSKAAKTSAYVGYDEPNQVSFARLKIDANGKANVTWGKPSGSVHNGYLGELRYDIVRYPDAKTVGTNISGLSFSETIKDKSLRNYYYGIIPVNGTKRGAERRTGAVSYGDNIVPPYYEDFSTEAAFDLFKVVDSNNDGKTWAWHEVKQSAYYATSDSKSANDWLITPTIQLEANHSYKVAFTARASSAYFPEKIEAKWGTKQDVASLTNTFLAATKLPATSTTYDSEIRTSAAQQFFLGIHAISDKAMDYIYVEDFSIVDNGHLNGPAAVENLTFTPDPTTALKATLSFTLPKKTVAGKALTDVTKVIVTRDGVTVKEFGASKAGATLSCDDNSPVAGFNNYTITAYTAEGAGTPTVLAGYVGLDKPAPLTKVNATDVKTGVKLTWDKASNRGTNGGAVITNDVTYNAYRVRISDGVTSQQLIGSATENSFTEKFNTTEGEQAVRLYSVGAKNSKGESEHVMSSPIVTGKAYTLPYTSHFAEGEANSLWWSLGLDEEGGIGFLLNTQTSSDGDSHCRVFTSFSKGGTADLSSGKIALAGANNPAVFFSYNGTTGKNCVLKVYAQTPDGTRKLIGTVDYSKLSGKAEDWRRTSFKIPAEMAKADYVMLTFVGEADTYGVVRIDDVCVRSIYDNDLAVSISAPAKMKRGVSGKATVTVTNNGEKEASNYRVMLTADGTLAFDQTVTEVLKPLQTKSFTVDVKSNVTSQSSKLRLVADVEYAADQYKADNTANCMADLAESGVPSPKNFSATNDQVASKLTMNWSVPTPASIQTRETFENYDNWTINQFGDWTTYSSIKSGETGGLWGSQGMPFPHENELYNYIVFNPDAIQDGITSQNFTLKPHGGEKCLMTMFAREIVNKKFVYYDADNWLISPMLSGEAQTVLFWANNGQPDPSNIRYPQTIEVYYSDKTNDHADFKKLETFTHSGGKWDSYTVDLPEGASYFAIRCATHEDNAYMLLLDDIVYKAGFGKLEGFRVYRNDKMIEQLPATATSYTVNYDPQAEPTRYSVSAVYTGGESVSVSSDDCQTAINGVTIDAQHPVDVYTVDGKLVMKNATSLRPLKRGVYVVNGVKIVK